MGKNFLGLDGLKHFWSKAKTWIIDRITTEVTAKIAEIVANAPEDLDTLKEISDWISSHANDAAAMNAEIKANTEAISGKADKNHTHIKSQITDFDHTHDDRYYTESEVDAKLSAGLADKQDFRIFKSLEEFNEKKGTSLTVVSGIDNMKDIANAMSNGEMLIIITKYELQSDVYFGLTTSTGWTKMFTFVKSNGLCDVECRTTFPLTFKRLLNSDGVVGDWQQLVTNDDIFRIGYRRNTIGWADLSKDVNIDGSSNFANNVGRIEGHNALIKISNPSIGYQWPVTNSGDSNVFVDFGGTIQYFVDKVNNHLYVRFADSVDMSAWGKILNTTVADVPITYINTFEDETYVKPTNTYVCSYSVTNGICVIKLETICLSTTDDFVQILSGLPKPKEIMYSNVIDRTMSSNSGARGLFQLVTNGTLRITCNYGDSSVSGVRNLYATFSYLVAES